MSGSNTENNNSTKRSSDEKPFPTQLPFVPLPEGELAKNVPADWWKTLFDEMYLKTDGDMIENNTITKSEVDLFLKVGSLSPNLHILDLCCGQGRHSLEFARRGFSKLDGLDYSDFLINLAKQRATTEKLAVTFKQGDARLLPYPDNSFDAVVMLANSFGYFVDKKDDIVVLNEVYRVLKSGGHILLDLTDGTYIRNNFNKKVMEWIGEDMYVYRERELAGDRLVGREVICNVDKGVIRDQFYAERLYNYDDIKQCLLNTNFKQLKYEDSISNAPSNDHPDLGMLAQRMIIKGYKL